MSNAILKSLTSEWCHILGKSSNNRKYVLLNVSDDMKNDLNNNKLIECLLQEERKGDYLII